MSYHPPLAGTLKVLVSEADHPKVPKGGNHQLDLECEPGQTVYAVQDGKIPHVGDNIFDGTPKGGTFFTIDGLREQKGVGPAPPRIVYGGVVRADRSRAVVKKGDPIGTTAGKHLHLGSNQPGVLDQILGR